MSDGDLGLRHRAALCHLASFPLLTLVWLPMVLQRKDPDNEFLVYHARGASIYQGLGVFVFLITWFLRMLPYRFLDEVRAGFLLALLGIIWLCALGMFFMGSIALAFQAWNGDLFSAPVVAWLMGYKEVTEE